MHGERRSAASGLDRLAGRASQRAGPAHPRRELAHAGGGARRPRRVRGGAYPRRALLRHRRDRRHPVEPAAHGPAGGEVRQPHARHGRRRRPPGGGLRHPRHLQRAQGLVDLPPLRQDRRRGPRRRPAEVARRGPAGRGRGADPARPPLHRPPRREPRPRRDPGRRQRQARRRPDRRRPLGASASAARRRSRGRACARATSRGRRTCPTASFSTPTAP